jgi:hypothetical protein
LWLWSYRGLDCGHSHISHENINQIEYLPPADTRDVLKKVHVAIYFSLNKLWDIHSELYLVTTILDSQMKNFPFVEESDQNRQKEIAKSLLMKNLYDQLQHIQQKKL